MSTEINIKKRITALDESVILTKDLNSINFVGAGVVASAIAEDVTVTISGGIAGSGTTNYLSKWTAATTLANSQTQDDGANIAVNGAILPTYKFAVYSTTPGENYNIYGNTTVNGAVGVGGVNTAVGASTNYGTAGEAQNSTTQNIGVYGQAIGASTENVGGKFSATLATSNYSVQLQDGTEGIGKVLTSMTADGKAQWVAPTSASGVLGISDSSGVYTYYTTLTLAMAAATSGKTITFFTDITETSNVEITLKDGVDINFNGYTYTLNTSGTANCFLANVANGRTRFYNGKIQRLGGTVNNLNSTAIMVSNVASTVYNLDFNGVEIYSSFGVGITGTSNTVPKINGVKLRTFSHGCYFGTGVFISNSYIETFGGGQGCYTSIMTNCYVVTTGGGNGVTFPYSGRIINCYVSVSGTGSGKAISCVSGTTITNCTAISTRNMAIYNFGATSVFTYAYSTAGNAFEAGSSTRGTAINSYGYSTAGLAYLYLNEISNCYGESTSQVAIDCFPSGNIYNSTFKSSANVVGQRFNRSIGSTFICTFNNVNGHAINPYAQAYIANNTLIVTNSGANCIYAVSSQLTRYVNNTFIDSTTPINANIVQQTTNTTDSQGNILM
jgi:hypothetical protein